MIALIGRVKPVADADLLADIVSEIRRPFEFDHPFLLLVFMPNRVPIYRPIGKARCVMPKWALLGLWSRPPLGLVVIVARIKAHRALCQRTDGARHRRDPVGIIADWWRSARARLRKPKRRAKAFR